jgi:hypothetical protein
MYSADLPKTRLVEGNYEICYSNFFPVWKLPQNVVFMRTCVSKHKMWTAETSNQCYLQAARVCSCAVTEMLPRTIVAAQLEFVSFQYKNSFYACYKKL